MRTPRQGRAHLDSRDLPGGSLTNESGPGVVVGGIVDSQHVRPGRRWWALVLLVALCCRPASAASAADCTPQLQVDAEYYVFPVGPQPACVVT